jgi:uncharacterized membrane protein
VAHGGADCPYKDPTAIDRRPIVAAAEDAMTDLPDPLDRTPREAPTLDRGLAMFGYLCLFFTVLFAGAPAFIAVILAYARKGDADPIGRSHYRFQILTFWSCFSLTVLSAIAGIAALIFGVAGLSQHWQPKPSMGTLVSWSTSGLTPPTDLSPAWILLLSSLGLFALAIAWTWLAPIWGGLKLAAGKPIGRV